MDGPAEAVQCTAKIIKLCFDGSSFQIKVKIIPFTMLVAICIFGFTLSIFIFLSIRDY